MSPFGPIVVRVQACSDLCPPRASPCQARAVACLQMNACPLLEYRMQTRARTSLQRYSALQLTESPACHQNWTPWQMFVTLRESYKRRSINPYNFRILLAGLVESRVQSALLSLEVCDIFVLTTAKENV